GQLLHGVELRHPPGAGVDAVGAADAARRVGRLHDAVLGAQDGVDGTHLGAGREGVLAVHAHRGQRRRGGAAVDEVEVHHRLAAVVVALAAGGDAGAAGDAAGRVDEDRALEAHAVGPSCSVGEAGTVVGGAAVLGATSGRSEAVVGSPGTGGRYGSGAGSSTRVRRHTAVLNAGIQLVGSKREIVSVLAATGEAQW